MDQPLLFDAQGLPVTISLTERRNGLVEAVFGQVILAKVFRDQETGRLLRRIEPKRDSLSDLKFCAQDPTSGWHWEIYSFITIQEYRYLLERPVWANPKDLKSM